jgi:predicted membrane protein
MHWLKLGFIIIILIASQLALRYSNGLIAGIIATLPVVGLITYYSAENYRSVALYIAVFMLTGSVMFFILYFIPRKDSYLAILLWLLLVIFLYKVINIRPLH